MFVIDVTVILEFLLVIFLFGTLVFAVGAITLLIIEHHNRKIERKIEREAEKSNRQAQLRRMKEEDAAADYFFDKIQRFYNGV